MFRQEYADFEILSYHPAFPGSHPSGWCVGKTAHIARIVRASNAPYASGRSEICIHANESIPRSSASLAPGTRPPTNLRWRFVR
ncbi:unnamed protein product, partial [Nesidiocoris tenuis]